MGLKNGKPCRKCGSSDWTNSGRCRPCQNRNNRSPHRVSARSTWQKSSKGRKSLKKRRETEAHRLYQQVYNHNNGSRHEGRIAVAEWVDLCQRVGLRCVKCRHQFEGMKGLEIDHINPNGKNTIDNIQPLCRSCNSSKGNGKAVRYIDAVDNERWQQSPMLI